MSDRDKSQQQKKSTNRPHEDPKANPPKDQDASDELSIEELEEAAGGTGEFPPPEPNVGC